MRRMASARKRSNGSVMSIKVKTALPQARTLSKKSATNFVVCVDNSDYEASLETHKIYPALADPRALLDGYIRVIDESGEDYLYEAGRFLAIDVPATLKRSI